MQSVEIRFIYGKNEFITAMKNYYKKRLKVIPDFIVSIAALLSGLSLIITQGASFISISLIASGFILLMIPLIGLFVMPAIIYNGDTKYQDEYHLIFSSDRIEFKTSHIDSKIEWKFYSEVWESKEFYYLLNTKRTVSVIPKRAFKNETDLSIFQDLIGKNFRGRTVQV